MIIKMIRSRTNLSCTCLVLSLLSTLFSTISSTEEFDNRWRNHVMHPNPSQNTNVEDTITGSSNFKLEAVAKSLAEDYLSTKQEDSSLVLRESTPIEYETLQLNLDEMGQEEKTRGTPVSFVRHSLGHFSDDEKTRKTRNSRKNFNSPTQRSKSDKHNLLTTNNGDDLKDSPSNLDNEQRLTARDDNHSFFERQFDLHFDEHDDRPDFFFGDDSFGKFFVGKDHKKGKDLSKFNSGHHNKGARHQKPHKKHHFDHKSHQGHHSGHKSHIGHKSSHEPHFNHKSHKNHQFDHDSHKNHQFDHDSHKNQQFDHDFHDDHQFNHNPHHDHHVDHDPHHNSHVDHNPHHDHHDHHVDHNPHQDHSFDHKPHQDHHVEHDPHQNHHFDHRPKRNHNFDHEQPSSFHHSKNKHSKKFSPSKQIHHDKFLNSNSHFEDSKNGPVIRKTIRHSGSFSPDKLREYERKAESIVTGAPFTKFLAENTKLFDDEDTTFSKDSNSPHSVSHPTDHYKDDFHDDDHSHHLDVNDVYHQEDIPPHSVGSDHFDHHKSTKKDKRYTPPHHSVGSNHFDLHKSTKKDNRYTPPHHSNHNVNHLSSSNRNVNHNIPPFSGPTHPRPFNNHQGFRFNHHQTPPAKTYIYDHYYNQGSNKRNFKRQANFLPPVNSFLPPVSLVFTRPPAITPGYWRNPRLPNYPRRSDKVRVRLTSVKPTVAYLGTTTAVANRKWIDPMNMAPPPPLLKH